MKHYMDDYNEFTDEERDMAFKATVKRMEELRKAHPEYFEGMSFVTKTCFYDYMNEELKKIMDNKAKQTSL